MGNLKRISYAAPFTATVTVNPLGEVSSERGDGVGGYNYSACSYNFDVSHGDLRCCKGFKRYGVPDYPAKPLKIYFYKRFNAAGEVDDRILFYCANKYIYDYNTITSVFNLVSDLKYDAEPEGVCYNFNGEDVMIFSDAVGNMKIYDGNNVSSVTGAPSVSSMCVHNERLFLTDGAQNNSLWFSDDFDPSNWNVSLSEAGFIDMSGYRGRLLKVISFGGYLFVFRSFGITRVTAYGDQSAFSVNDLFVSSGKIYGNSITVCGDCVLFLASDGLYRFDGLTTRRISDDYRDFIDFTFGGVKGEYYGGRAYFILKANFEGVSDTAILTVNPKNYADYYFIRGAAAEDIAVIAGENNYRLVILANEKMQFLCDESVICGTEPEKVWLSKFGDFGLKAKRKILDRVSFYTDKSATVTVKADDKTRTFTVKGGAKKREIKPRMAGDRFSIKIKCTEAKSKVVGLRLKFTYYDE